MLRLARQVSTALLVVAIVSVGLICLVNAFHIDGAALARGTDALLERADRLRRAAGPGYQRSALSAMPANPTVGRTYRLDDLLSRAAIVDEPEARHDDPRLEVLEAFDFDEEGALVAAHGDLQTEIREGVLRVRMITTEDHLRNLETLQIPKDEIGEVALRLRARSGRNLRLGWSKQSDPARVWEHSVDIPLVADGEFHTYVVNARQALRRGLKRDDAIRALFVRPSDSEGDVVELDFVRFLSRRSRYGQQERGVLYETIAAEVRPVLYMRPRQVLEWTIEVPHDEPRLDFGTGVVGPESTVDFRVELRSDERSAVLYDEQMSDTERWHDARCDLSRWAGETVALRLSVDGSGEGVGLWSSPTVSARPPRPLRVVWLLEDTLRADHLSLYGYGRETSPFKKRLARQHGVTFLNAFSQATKTRPSVPSMFTSLLPSATGVWSFFDRLDPAYLTVAEILRAQGFVTASFVQNGNAGPYAGLHQGFDTVLDPETTGERPEDLLLGERLWGWMERHRDRNSLLYLHVTDPHGPYDPPEPYDEWFSSVEANGDAQRFDPSIDADWNRGPTTAGRMALYDGEIRHNDAVLEEFFARLRAAELFEDTLFVLVSDHGEHFGEHGVWEHRPPGTRQVTGVPLLLVLPGGAHVGERVETVVQLMDVMPTILEAARVDPSGLVMQGDSLLGLMAEENPRFWRDRVVVSEEPVALDKARPERNEGLHVFGSMIYDDWHLIASRGFWPGEGGLPESLRLRVYSLRDDPGERNRLWRYWADVRLRYVYTRTMNRLSRLDRQAWRRFTVDDSDRTIELDPDGLDRLRALGYVD